MSGQKPLVAIKAGLVSSAIFENEITVNGKKVTVMKATLQRRYKDKDGTWKSSGSYGKHEIPQVAFCLPQAHAVMLNEGQSTDEESE